MISLKPREQFMIIRKLGDHTDLTTYYVQAVVRNSVSGAVLETFNMADAGSNSRRFYKLYEIPADISGEGFWIDITTTVYTDSGYTTKAETYSEELEQYLVYDRTLRSGGGGGGADVDYKKIEKILKKMIDSMEKPQKVDLAPVLLEIGHVLAEVKAIEIPEQEKQDDAPVLEAIRSAENNIIKSIAEKEVTPETELGEVITKLDAVLEKEPKLDEVFGKIEEVKTAIEDFAEQENKREEEKAKISQNRLGSIQEVVRAIVDGDTGQAKPKRDERITRLISSNQ